MSLSILLAQLPLTALHLSAPPLLALALGTAEGALLTLYASCYPRTTSSLSLITALRTLLTFALVHDVMCTANAIAGLALGLFVAGLVAGSDERCAGCLAMRRWEERKDGPGGGGEEPFWVTEEPF